MTKYAFFEGAIVPIEQATVSVMTHALHYGTACFGGIRGYWNEKHQNLYVCLLYTSDAADERSSVDLGGRRIIKKKKNRMKRGRHRI